MNFKNSKYDNISTNSQIKKILIAKGIEQAWSRRFSYNIHSGVRVKIQRKNLSFNKSLQQQIDHESKLSSCNQINHMQSMLKRRWIESETSALCQNGQKSLENTHKSSQNQSFISYQTKPILNNNILKKNYSSEINQKTNKVNSIGIQTTNVTQIDRQTSCNIVRSSSMPIEKIYKSQSSSSSSYSISETSLSEDNSTHTNNSSTETSTVSDTTIDTSENNHHNIQYRRNKNRNNNAIDPDVKQKNNYINTEEFKVEKNNEQQLQDINNSTQYYHQSTSLPILSTDKKCFFSTFLNLFSFLRLSSFKRDRICIPTTNIDPSKIIDTSRNEGNKNIRSPKSRCKRSTPRNFNHSSSIDPEQHFFPIKSNEDSLSKLKHLEQKPSTHSISSISISTRKQSKQLNNSSLSVINSNINYQKSLSYQSKKTSNKIKRKKRSHRKENRNNQHHKRKYLHQKKRKHIRTSNKSSHSQFSSQLRTLSMPSTTIKIQPLSSTNDQSKVCAEENMKSTDSNKPSSNNICLSFHNEPNSTSLIPPNIENNSLQKEILTPQHQYNLSLKPIDNLSTEVLPCTTINSKFKSYTVSSSFSKKLNEDKQYFSPPTDSIRLRVKNKNLISNLSQSKILFSSVYSVDNAIHHHQMNTVNEFKSILQHIKNNHMNNNALDDTPIVNIPSLKSDTTEILSSNKSSRTFFSMKNRNENKIPSFDNQSISTGNSPININQLIKGQNKIIQEGIHQLIRYQNFAKSYKLKSNKVVKQFLMKSIALSPESLHKLSIINEPNPTNKTDKKPNID